MYKLCFYLNRVKTGFNLFTSNFSQLCICQVIYEACYTTTDLETLEYFQSRGATKTSRNIESTSSSNHRVDGTGKGSEIKEGVSADNLSVSSADDGALGLSLTSCLRLCQSRDDKRLSNDPAEEPTSSPTLAGVTPTEGTVDDSEAKGSAVFSFSATGFDSILSEQLVSPVPDSVKLTVNLDMTDNLQENKVKEFGTELKKNYEATTNCYKGIVYQSIFLL